MKIKSFILIILTVFILSISTLCFATDTGNDIKNAVNGATNTVVDGAQNLAEDVRDGVGTAENTIENGVNDIGNAVMDGENSIEDAGDDVMNAANDIGDTGNDAYTATRSSVEDLTTDNSMNASIWTWIAVAIAGIVIVGLVWYYASQNNKN